MGWRDAPRYSAYLERARRIAPQSRDAEVAAWTESFLDQGYAAFTTSQTAALARAILDRVQTEEAQSQLWNADGRYALGEIYTRFPEFDALFHGTLGAFLRGVYGAPFKIYYGVMYKSVPSEAPSGSQLWHSDGGPGTCVNVMFCLSDVTRENGAMELLPWSESLALYVAERPAIRRALGDRKVDKATQRDAISGFYAECIAQQRGAAVKQPIGGPGMVLAFRNNLIHKGGYPRPGQQRYVCVFHVYPSDKPTPFERYRAEGIAKRGAYPIDPAEDF
jgi:hypothetical protein